LLVASCSSVELPSDMLILDQDFIAVWLPAQKCELDEAKSNYAQLNRQWDFFKRKYRSQIVQENAQDEVRLLEQWLEETGHCLEQWDDVCVKVKLDQFKYQIQSIRNFWEVDYFLDYLWHFEEELNRFVEIGTDPKLDLLEWNEFMPYLMAVNTSFDRLYEKDLDPEFLDFDPDRLAKWEELKNDLVVRVSCLNGLTEGAQLEEIANCALGIQETTYEAIALFGNVIYQPEIIY